MSKTKEAKTLVDSADDKEIADSIKDELRKFLEQIGEGQELAVEKLAHAAEHVEKLLSANQNLTAELTVTKQELQNYSSLVEHVPEAPPQHVF